MSYKEFNSKEIDNWHLEEFQRESINTLKKVRSTSSSLCSNSSSNSINISNLPDPKSPYSSITHKVREIVPQDLACKVGCKGSKCKYDNSNWSEDQMVLKGLFSSWITDSILATARPRTSLIKNDNLILQMKKNKIKSIFNLQSRNEHKDCGDGIEKNSGFSYDPVDFTSAGIYYYNFELQDYSVTNMANLVDMVKVLCFALSEGKAAVHCHAGLGRTGLFIVCYLIFSQRMSAKDAIYFVRDKRPGSVQMQQQIDAAKDFENYLKPLRVVYSNIIFDNYYLDDVENCYKLNKSNTNECSFSLNTFLNRQKILLHGYERKKLKYIPKIIYVCGEQLKKLALVNFDKSLDIEKFSKNLVHSIVQSVNKKMYDKKDENYEYRPNFVVAKALCVDSFTKKIMKKVKEYQIQLNQDNDSFRLLEEENNPLVLTALMWFWLDQLKEPVLRNQEINILLFKKSILKKNDSKSYLEKDEINWKQLDKGTLNTINYFIGLIQCLMPLENEIENELIDRVLSCLTQSKIEHFNVVNRNFNNENITLFNSPNQINVNNINFLKNIIRDLTHNSYVISDNALGKTNFKGTSDNYYDFDEKDKIENYQILNKKSSANRNK